MLVNLYLSSVVTEIFLPNSYMIISITIIENVYDHDNVCMIWCSFLTEATSKKNIVGAEENGAQQ